MGRGRLAVAAMCTSGFAVALVALVSAQLALMSVLDRGRAEHAAARIAESRFTADIISQTVTRAVAPVAGDDLATRAAATASSDPAVRAVVETSLLEAHRQIVDPDAPAAIPDGNLAVGTAIVTSVIDQARAQGVDLEALGFPVATSDPAAIARSAGLPSVVPDDVPRLGLERAASITRSVALVATLALGALAAFIHPSTGRAVRMLGMTVVAVTGAWLIALVAGGWIIDAISATLFGEMLDAVWSDTVAAMLLAVVAGVLIGAGMIVGGVALDGYLRRRAADHGGRPMQPGTFDPGRSRCR